MATLKPTEQTLPMSQIVIAQGFVARQRLNEPFDSTRNRCMVFRGFTLELQARAFGSAAMLADAMLYYPDKRCKGNNQRGYLWRNAWDVLKIQAQDGAYFRKFPESPRTVTEYLACRTEAFALEAALNDLNRQTAGIAAYIAGAKDYTTPFTANSLTPANAG